MTRLSLTTCLLLLSCGDDRGGVTAAAQHDVPQRAGTDTAQGPMAPAPMELIDDLAWLTRASLDLRGVRPSVEELDAVAADPGAIEGLLDEMVEDDRLALRMAWLWNDQLHTAVWGASYDRFGELEPEVWQAMGMEPLQLIAAVIAEDRPFTDIVTAEQTQANGYLAELYPLEAGGDWGWASYTDGRPAAGILTTSTLWLRYTADAVNYNRTRANTVARIFLCADFLDRDSSFEFDISAESLASVERAVSEEPACLTCHASLDPLASFFGGFAEQSDQLEPHAYVAYSPFQAEWYAARNPPRYYGVPGRDLADLGAMVAADARFARCTAERFHTGLVGAAPTDPVELDALHLALVDSDMDVRTLVREIVGSEAYREVGDRVLRVEQLQSALDDLLGLEPGEDVDEGLNPLSWSVEHRVLAGGTDDAVVLERNPAPGMGLQLMTAWAARRVVQDVVVAERALELDDRALLRFDADDTGEDSVRSGLAVLHTRMLSLPVEPESAEIDRLYVLWQDAGGGADRTAAWTAVVMALVRHPEQVVH